LQCEMIESTTSTSSSVKPLIGRRDILAKASAFISAHHCRYRMPFRPVPSASE
jgi:hypothetical protein